MSTTEHHKHRAHHTTIYGTPLEENIDAYDTSYADIAKENDLYKRLQKLERLFELALQIAEESLQELREINDIHR
jgi:hypothetical protein